MNDNSALSERYAVVKRVANEAAALGLAYYRQRDSLTVLHKENNRQDLVSLADQAVEQYICRELAQVFPQDGLLGEEGGSCDLQARYLWVIDTIDGTSCFLNGVPSWCVSIGLLMDGRPVLGAIADPNQDELFHACLGQGAFVNDTPIHVHRAQQLNEGLTGIGTTYRQGKELFLPFLHGLLEADGMFVRHGSSALTIAYVAAGRLLGYYETWLKSWDCIAGLAILREAGGMASDFSQPSALLEGHSLLVACPGVYAQLATLIGLSLEP